MKKYLVKLNYNHIKHSLNIWSVSILGLLVVLVVFTISTAINRNNGRTKSKTDVACLEQIETQSKNESVRIFEGTPETVDFTTMPEAQTFYTNITKAVASGSNFAGHFTLVHWGCGTDCFGYAVVNTETGEVVAYSMANENYHLREYGLDEKVFVMEPVYANEERKFYKIIEEENRSSLELVCTEISTQDMYGFLE